jgi:putative ABC transport system permease protein
MTGDLVRLGYNAIVGHRLRSLLSMLGIAIGVAAVILLTSIGEGTRQFILAQFSQFGTNIISINPGKAQTFGVPGVLGGTTYKLSFADAAALARIAGVEHVVPLTYGTGRVEANGRGRSVFVYGVTPDIADAWHFRVRQGGFWPPDDPDRGAQMAVLGPTVKRELFGDADALGAWVRIAGSRFRVVGIMEPKGQMLGIDIGDAVYVPVATGMAILHLDELSELHVTYASSTLAPRIERDVRQVLTARHGGREDFTVTSQQAMLDVFGNVMGVITMAVGAIAGISLLVGAIGILTMMWIAVGERTGEIGLLRAIGATRGQVQALFLVEAGLLGVVGGATGATGGLALCGLLRLLVTGLPVHTPLTYVAAALGVSLVAGLASGVGPARRAAALDPIEALRAE